MTAKNYRGLRGLRTWSPSSWPGRSPYQSGDPDQQAGTDEPSNQVAEPSAQDDSKEAQNCACDCRPDNAKQDIRQHPHITLHELLGQPASNPADDDGCDPAYRRISHSSSPRKGAPCTKLGIFEPAKIDNKVENRRACDCTVCPCRL